MHQIIYNMLVTKDPERNLFEYICPWIEILASIAYEIKDSYPRTLVFMPGLSVYVKDVLFNLM